MPSSNSIFLSLILKAATLILAASFTNNHVSLVSSRAVFVQRAFVQRDSSIQSEWLIEPFQQSYEPFLSPLPIDDPYSTKFTVRAHPPIHWTVPGMNLGYRDKSGQWHDKDGLRKGPPQNYWRQASDEREYKKDMDVVDAALLNKHPDLEAAVEVAEKSFGARFPLLSRKLLGTWAPVLHAGEKVVDVVDGSPDDCEEGATIECSVIIDIQRAAGPRFAPKTYYGVFYETLDDGEEIRVVSSDGAVDSSIRVSKENGSKVVGDAPAGKLEAPICVGKITYVSDYILVQRREDGGLDLWLRVDTSYLGNF